MANIFSQQKRKEQIMIVVFIVVVAITFYILWQGGGGKKKILPVKLPQPRAVTVTSPRLEINFKVLESSILKELQIPFIIEPPAVSPGRENPFLPY